jgi:hypothetical protein
MVFTPSPCPSLKGGESVFSVLSSDSDHCQNQIHIIRAIRGPNKLFVRKGTHTAPQ